MPPCHHEDRPGVISVECMSSESTVESSRVSRVESFSQSAEPSTCWTVTRPRFVLYYLLSRATSPCHFCCAWRHCTCTGIEEIVCPLNDTESIWRWRHKRAPCRRQGVKQRRRHIKKVQIQTQHQATMHGRCLQGSLFRPRTADCSVEARTGRGQGVFLRFFNFLGCLFIFCVASICSHYIHVLIAG